MFTTISNHICIVLYGWSLAYSFIFSGKDQVNSSQPASWMDMRNPLDKVESVKYQQLSKALEVQELLESNNSSIEEENNSNLEWLKQDPKNQEVEDEEDTSDNKESKDKPVVVEATMVSTPSVGASVLAMSPVTTRPAILVGIVGKENGKK